MKSDKFVNSVVENRDDIVSILGIEKLKEDVEVLKRENEMLNFLFSKIFKADDNAELGELKKENNEFKGKNNELEKRLTFLSKENHALKGDLDDLKAQLQELFEKNEQNPLTSLKNLYDSLDNTTKNALDSLFKTDDELSIFASGILNIKPVWDYAAYLIKEHKDSEFEKLKDIFYLLFETFKTVKNVSLQQVTVGDKFDMDYFSRDNRSEKQSGKVAAVVLIGFLENGKIVKKSIVKVK